MVRSPNLDNGVLVGFDDEAIAHAGASAWAVFVHEIVHAMGLWGHVPSGRYGPHEMMDNTTRSVSPPSLHHFLALVHHYDPRYLGGWAGDYEVLQGSTGDVRYELWLINETLAWPFFGGLEQTLAPLRELGGSASWRGGLVGYTSARRFVEGTSALDYDFGVNRLSADFTWDGGGAARYPRVETGVLGSIYAEDAAGTMHGFFFGDGYEYVGGSLDRIDITAAFGAAKD